MTRLAYCLDCPPLKGGLFDFGYSKESNFLRRVFKEEIKFDSSTAQCGINKRLARIAEELIGIYHDCNQEGWDGYGAEPIREASLEDSLKLYTLLPDNIPEPDLTPEPDGSIGFGWYRGPWRTLSLSVRGDGIIVYSGLFGGNDTDHGHKPLTERLDANIHGLLNRLYQD